MLIVANPMRPVRHDQTGKFLLWAVIFFKKIIGLETPGFSFFKGLGLLYPGTVFFFKKKNSFTHDQCCLGLALRNGLLNSRNGVFSDHGILLSLQKYF